MKAITFFDTETDPQSGKILDIGAIRSDGNTFHSKSLQDFAGFLTGTAFICGHNIINHDLKYIQQSASIRNRFKCIDTLYLSPLLFAPILKYLSENPNWKILAHRMAKKQEYQLTGSRIRFILFWEYRHEATGETRDIKIALPELYFDKT